MRTRSLLLVAGAAIVGGLGVAWLTRDDRPAGLEPRQSTEAETTPAQLPLHTSEQRRADASSTSRADSAPPAPSAGSAEPRFQRDPTKPGYDAAKLLVLMNDDARGVFAMEPRSEPWASEREGDIVSLTLPEFQFADRDAQIEVECRTATCRVRVHSRKPMLIAALGSYPLSCLANWTVPWWGVTSPDEDLSGVEDPHSDFYMIFGPETRGRAGFIARLDSTCARYRDEWRQKAMTK